jgi:hypothetical protein
MKERRSHTIIGATHSGVARCLIATVSVLAVGGAVRAAPAQPSGLTPAVHLGQYLGGAYSPATVQQFVSDLARAGIPVFAPGAATPMDPVAGRPSPLRLSLDQAQTAALGISAHAGVTGARLDGLVRLTSGRLVVPFGAIVAGWAKRARTPAGALARRILGRPDWRRYRQTVFPVAVLLLFSADVGAHLPGSQPASALDEPLATAAAFTPCSAVDGFIKSAIDSFFASLGHLHTNTSAIRRLFGNGLFGDIIAGVGDVLSWSVNSAVNVLHQVVINGYKLAIGTVTSALASVAGAAAVAGSVLGALQKWSGAITAAPNPTSKGVGTGIPGTLVLDVTAFGSQLQWDPWIVDCANVFNIPLPTLTPKNADVKWNLSEQNPAGLVVERSNTGPLNDQGKAQLNFSTTAESPELARGEVHLGTVVAHAQIHRTDLDQLEQRLTNTLVGDLPTIVQTLIGPSLRAILAPVLNQLGSKLGELRDLDVAGSILVRYHTPKPPRKKGPGKGKHGPGGTGGTELRYPLPNACSLLTLGDVAAAMVPGPIDGPKRAPTIHLGSQSESACNWQATYLPSPFPPGAVSVTNAALRSPSVKIATQGWAHGQLPGTVRTTVLGHPAYYRSQDAGNYKNQTLFVLVDNVVLKVLTNRVDEATVKSLMRAMISHLPSPRRVPVKP